LVIVLDNRNPKIILRFFVNRALEYKYAMKVVW